MARRTTALILAFLLTGSAQADVFSYRYKIVGPVTVINGDSLDMVGIRLRLFGIDAPEYNTYYSKKRQFCKDTGGKDYPCGWRATEALAAFIRDQIVTCYPTGKYHEERAIAYCNVGDTDLSGWMVQHGWAIAYRYVSKNYVPDEYAARRKKIGVWQGSFVKPWEWRRLHKR